VRSEQEPARDPRLLFKCTALADETMAGVEGTLTATARIAFQAAEHGDLRRLRTLLEKLAGVPVPEIQAWRLALEALRWSFEPRRAPAPRLDEVQQLVKSGGPAVRILAQTCAVMERVAFCTIDGPLLSDWIDLHASTATAGGGDPESEDLALRSARLWKRILAGETAGLDAAAKTLSEEASRQSTASVRIEATVIRALVALTDGMLDEATDLGRRACRMAQAEALSHHEYLANITLARIRRYGGRPHLALHILAALDRVAPATWAGWIGWETLLAGGTRPPSKDHLGPSANAEQRLRDLLEAARGGNRATFCTTAAEASRAARIWPPWADEMEALLAALDPLRQPVSTTVATWSRGDTPTIPFGLHGIGIPQSAVPQVDSAAAYVVAGAGERGRRVLLPGLGLAGKARVLAQDSARSGARTETGIAALALTGDGGQSRDEFFCSVYGFKFVAHRHRGVLDTLCHRMRALLGNAGEIRRDEADLGATNDSPPPTVTTGPTPAIPSITLVLRETIVVPDMRCGLPSADRVLRALALLGATSASATADSLHIPLRTVQAVLQQLVAEGACTIERDGRRVAYRIEDTTFTEVTSA
jgi:hypothetical protein